MAIHGRTRSQGYSGKANWNYIKQVKAESQIPIIGNGDIITAKQAVDTIIQSQCDGIMIGRGCIKRPWILKEALHLYQNKEEDLDIQDPNYVIQKLHYYLTKDVDEYKVLLQMKKFVSWFSSGYVESKTFRRQLFQIKNIDQLMSYSQNYFEKVKNLARQEESDFMMGGHG